MNKESLKYLRHELRTYLNHIIGYSEILMDDLQEAQLPGFLSDIEKVFEESQNIQKVFQASFYQDGKPIESFDTAAFRRNLFGPLYIIIGLAQRLKKQCEDEGTDYLLSDVLKVLDSARKILDLVEQELRSMEMEQLDGNETEYPYTMGNLSRATQFSLHDQNLGHILVVDDNEMNRDILVRHLERQGHQISAVENGYKALQILREDTFDLVLLDIMMPGLNGYQVLEKLKSDQILREIPVIMISALDEMDSVVHCISLGAEDYLPKSFDPILLKARISACLSKKHYRDQEQKYIKALLESQRQLEKELAEAADYVKELLPKPVSEGRFKADWIFQPSAKLGGDCFDYHWITPDKLVIYLLDVSGHGIGAALLSVSVMNVLRSQALPNTDFGNPSQVLGVLNNTFQMENQNNMYFTIWYGVYDVKSRVLQFASAGAPPALLLENHSKTGAVRELTTTDMIIGVDSDYQYENKVVEVPNDTRLYLFSDGVYEIRKSNGKMLVFREFMDLLSFQSRENKQGSTVNAVLNQIQGLSGVDHFDDDFSLLEIGFPATPADR